MLLCLLVGLLLSARLEAKEQIPPFEEVTTGVEYREVLLESPRPISILMLRCDPQKVRFHLLLGGDGGHKSVATADEMVDRHRLISAVNSSYFGRQNEILGYAERAGEVLNREVSQEGLFTAFFGWNGRKAFLKRRGEAFPQGLPLVFQCGPRLVWDSLPVDGLESTRLANRTVLALDDEGRVSIVVLGGLSHVTLAELPALLLASEKDGGVEASRAVNLDGG